ncbi:hypothetical protein C0992_009300 [Termitomyces sp. T32_za158]|nr:hypothetical protein C0992_009300 [Termitomyces sp. T32_za158]
MSVLLIDLWTAYSQVALFTAIVATFFVQALTGLSEDPVIETNRLIANLIEVVLLVHKADIISSNMTQPEPFKPEGSAVRACFYWSLALVLSISIACLAVTMRGFVGKILRSRHKQAYLNLGDFQKNWTSAQRSLGPTIEILPQLLAPPVLLFLVGFLDTLISASIPLSSSSVPIFVAGVIACICFAAAGAYTAYMTVSDHLQYSSSILIGLANLRLQVCSLFSLSADNTKDDFAEPWTVIQPLNSDPPSTFGEPMYPWSDTEPSLSNEIHYRFYAAICATHNDDAVDQAVAAIPSLIEERRLSVPQCFAWKFMNLIPATQEEIRAFLHLLSTDVSPRANLAIATSIATTLTKGLPYGSYVYEDQDTVDFVRALLQAAKRHDAPQPTIAAAIAKLLWYRDGRAHDVEYDRSFEDLCSQDPFLALLAVPFHESSGLKCAEVAFRGIYYTHVKEYRGSISVRHAAEQAFQVFMPPLDKNFRAAFSYGFSKFETCLFYMSGEGLTNDEYPCIKAFMKWFFSPSSPKELDRMLLGLKQVVKHFKDMIHTTGDYFPSMRLAGILLGNFTATTLQTTVAQRDWSDVLETCAIFAQTVMGNTSKNLFETSYTKIVCDIIFFLQYLKDLDPGGSGLRLSNENWQALHASATKYLPPDMSQHHEHHANTHIMEAFRRFVLDEL